MAPQHLFRNPAMMQRRPEDQFARLCSALLIPAVMTVRSLCAYANAYYMNWVSNKVLTDIRNELFGKMLQPLDGFL